MMFDGFNLDGIDYYHYKGKYYADNCVICESISIKEFRYALTEFLIRGGK